MIVMGSLLVLLTACSLARAVRPVDQTAAVVPTTAPFVDLLSSQLVDVGEAYDEFVTVQDDSKAIQVFVPVEWTQVDGSAWELDNKVIGASISASADLEAFRQSFSQPGVYFGVSNDMVKLASYSDMLNLYQKTFSTNCKFNTRTPYRDSTYQGAYDIYTNCSSLGNTMLLLSAQPSRDIGAYVLVVLVNLKSKADAAALDRILATMKVVGELP
jgi:hypothetical protein